MQKREIWLITERQRAEVGLKCQSTGVSVVEPKAGWPVELVGGNAGDSVSAKTSSK